MNEGFEVSCEICESDTKKEVLEISNDKFLKQIGLDQKRVRNVICLNCGFVYQYPKINLMELELLYKEKYREIQGLSEEYIRHHSEIQPKKANYILSNLPDKPSNALDIGCAAGFFLNELRKRKIEVFGNEPNLSFAEYARNQFNLPVTSEMFSAKLYKDDSFELITVIQTLEHVFDLSKFISDTRKLLSRGGGNLY